MTDKLDHGTDKQERINMCKTSKMLCDSKKETFPILFLTLLSSDLQVFTLFWETFARQTSKVYTRHLKSPIREHLSHKFDLLKFNSWKFIQKSLSFPARKSFDE